MMYLCQSTLDKTRNVLSSWYVRVCRAEGKVVGVRLKCFFHLKSAARKSLDMLYKMNENCIIKYFF